MSDLTTAAGCRSQAEACTNRAERYSRYGDHLKAAHETTRASEWDKMAALLEVSEPVEKAA